MAAVLDALASYVQSTLMEMAKEELQTLLGVSDEIDKMGRKLGDIKNFLADADRRSITDLTVQAWVRELRDTMYDATDILDLCQLKAMERGPSRDMGCFNPLLFCIRNPLHAHDIGNRIKDLNKRIDSIKERSASFKFINLGSYKDRGRMLVSSRSTRETTGELDESSLVGEKIEEDTRNLVEMLTMEEVKNCKDKLMIFAIVGVGGIGKTTLAQKIFNHDIIQQDFPKKIWLSVNQDFDEIELLRRTIAEVGGNQSAGNSRSVLEQALKEALNGQKTLLVMDDVWNNRAWDYVLKTPLVNVLDQGSRVLITTRHDMVARQMMAKKPYHHVGKLNPEDAWLLLKKQVVGNENDETQIDTLKDIGMRIVAKCDCLPLAVKVMGGLLCKKKPRRRDWENVLSDSIWSVSQIPEELNSAIYLSYDDLHPNLKPCFLHYSLLPKSALFFVDDIVGMWISEGFVHENSRDLEEIGREYYEELILRNLIEPNIRYTDQRVCNMHDVVRSFGQYVARDEALVAHDSEVVITGKLNSKKFIRLSVETEGSESNDLEWSSLQAHISLRTLISVGNIKIKPGDSLVSFSHLRTLHISSVNFDALSDSLYQLKHLRYLSIKNTNTSRLPENITKMKFLQYINLANCKSLVMLPSGLAKLQQLRVLKLTGTSINNIPRGFSRLTNLRKLYGFPAHMDGDWCSLEELGPLVNLIDLTITGMENVSSSSSAIKVRLGEKTHLGLLWLNCNSRLIGDDGRLVQEEEGVSENEQRQIEDAFDELCPPPYLEYLKINGYFGRRLPRWMMSIAVEPFLSLRILKMFDLACCTELPDGLCQLPCLELLQIIRAPAIKYVGPEFLRRTNSQVGALFPRLLELRFVGMVEWEEWEWEEKVQAMPVLELLTIHGCKLRHVPCGLSFQARNLRNLSVRDVKHLKSLEGFASVVDVELLRNTDLERISNLPKLQKLVIVGCLKMKVLEGMPALQRLVLADYDMVTMPRYMQDVNPRHLLLYCSLPLLTSIAAVKSSPEWDKLSHIQQVKAYSHPRDIPSKWYVLYTRDPFRLETNIDRSVIHQARMKRTWFPSKTCPIEDEWPVGRHAHADKCLPLCLRFRCNAYFRLVPWLRRECLHCCEAARIASSSDQWTEAAVYRANRRMTRY